MLFILFERAPVLMCYYDFTHVTVTIVTVGNYGYNCNLCKGNQRVNG